MENMNFCELQMRFLRNHEKAFHKIMPKNSNSPKLFIFGRHRAAQSWIFEFLIFRPYIVQ